MITVTTDTVPGKQIVRVIDVVKGNTVRARHVGHDILAGLRTVFGGEVEEYSALLAEAREEAMGRMMREAEGLGANAVVNVRLGTSAIQGGAAEILAYGTAVVVD